MIQHAPLPSVPKKLLQCASALNDDPLTPLHVPPTTVAFLHRLSKHCDHSSKPLGRFLLPVAASRLVDAIGQVALPEEIRMVLLENERLQREKEDAIAFEQWDIARATRDKQD